MPRRKRRLASRVRNYVRQLLAFLFSNVGVIVLVVAYTIAGAFMFQAIEGASEIERGTHMARERDNTAQYLWQNVTLKFNPLNETAMKNMISIELRQYQRKIVVAVRRGWDGGRSSRQWSFSSAFLYSLTVITTIGYGHLAPRTSWGKIATIFYALLGMPLFLLYLSNVGELLARWFKCLYALVCLCRGCPGFTRRRVLRIRTQLEVSEPESIERPDHWGRYEAIPDHRCPPNNRIPPNQRHRPDNRHLKDRFAPNIEYPTERFSPHYRIPPYTHSLDRIPSDYRTAPNRQTMDRFPLDNRIPPNKHTVNRFPADYRIPPNYRNPLDRFPPNAGVPPYHRHTLERFPPHYKNPQNHRYPLDRFPPDHRIPLNHRRWMSHTIETFPLDYRIPPNYRHQPYYRHPMDSHQTNYRNPPYHRQFQDMRYPHDYRYAPETYPPDFRYPPHPQRHFQRSESKYNTLKRKSGGSLFAFSDTEDDDNNRSALKVEVEPVKVKRPRKKRESAQPSSSSSTPAPAPPPSPAPALARTKAAVKQHTSASLLSSDSEDEEEARRARKKSALTSCLTRRVADGVIRRMTKREGDTYVEVRVYNAKDLVAAKDWKERLEKASLALKYQAESDAPEFAILKKFLTVVKENFSEAEGTFFADKK